VGSKIIRKLVGGAAHKFASGKVKLEFLFCNLLNLLQRRHSDPMIAKWCQGY